MRQVCNVMYAYLAETKSEQGRDELDRILVADDPSTVSRGTGALLALMGGPRTPRGGG